MSDEDNGNRDAILGRPQFERVFVLFLLVRTIKSN